MAVTYDVAAGAAAIGLTVYVTPIAYGYTKKACIYTYNYAWGLVSSLWGWLFDKKPEKSELLFINPLEPFDSQTFAADLCAAFVPLSWFLITILLFWIVLQVLHRVALHVCHCIFIGSIIDTNSFYAIAPLSQLKYLFFNGRLRSLKSCDS
jgi:hypothetical protein